MNDFISGNVAISVAILWSIAWKGVALWKAARADSKSWYIALLVVNTLGILEILYIFAFSRFSEKREKAKKSKND